MCLSFISSEFKLLTKLLTASYFYKLTLGCVKGGGDMQLVTSDNPYLHLLHQMKMSTQSKA